ncbi:unnamed protein product [Acanthosepion pharaonis]|uniref:Uncharacterized protein n=1 Tax=Acanthosepion pharaonis TaxID=158019 RepID=A0A812ANA0_ACAPH|nr:unnamed protein product [Sepia pharaonis]
MLQDQQAIALNKFMVKMRCVHLFYFFISSNFISSFFIFIPVPTAYTGALFLWHIIIVTFNFFNNDPFLAGNSSSTFISIFISTTFAVSPCSSPPSSDVHSASLSLHFALVTYFFCRKTCKDAAHFLSSCSLVAFNLQ